MLPKRFDLLKGFGTDYMLNLTGVTFRNFRVNAEGNQSFLRSCIVPGCAPQMPARRA